MTGAQEARDPNSAEHSAPEAAETVKAGGPEAAENAGQRGPERHRVRRIFRTHPGRILCALAAAAAALFFLQGLVPTKVFVIREGFDGQKMEVAETRAANVEDFLQELGGSAADETSIVFTTNEDGKLRRRKAGDLIRSGMTVKILEAEKTSADIEGKDVEILAYPGTVEDTLRYNHLKYDEDDRILPGKYERMSADTKVVLQKVVKKSVDRTESVAPSQTDETLVLDSSLSSGVVRSSPGTNGSAVYTYTTTYVNGQNAGTEKTLKKWIKQPTKNVVHLGTSRTGENGTVTASRTFTASATAYYAGTNARGATGQRVHYGTCAVDPRVIPYGTKLYVVGYGIAVANDCGGAVKGNIIDLYMDSTSACISWGRRAVKVYVLK